MATTTERLAIVVEANASKAIAEFKQVGGAAKTLGGDVGKTGGLMSNLSGQLSGLATGGAGLAAGLATVGTAIATFAADGTQKFVDLVGRVEAFQRIVGGTPESASLLVAAFDDVGIEAEAAGAAIFQLEKRIGANSAVLAKYGIQIARDTQGNTDMSATILNVSDAYRGIRDPVERATFLTGLFGKQSAAVTPLLERTRAEIQGFFADAKDSNQIVSEEDKLRVRAYREAMDDLRDTVAGLQMEVGEKLVPGLTTLAGNIVSVIKWVDDLAESVDGMGESWRTFVDEHLPQATEGFSGLVRDLGKGLTSGSPGAFFDSLRSGADEVGNSMGGAGDAVTGFNEQLDGTRLLIRAVNEEAGDFGDLDKALMGAVGTERALGASHRSLADAQEDLNDLLKEGAVDIEKVADAERSLASATRSLGHARREQRAAQEDYNDALAAFIALPTDTNADKLADAKDNLADADDSVASALERQNSAQADLARARAGDPDYQNKLADARQRVADATQNLADKSLANVTAQKAETEALSAHADQVERLLGYYGDLIAKHPETSAALAPLIGGLSGWQPLPPGLAGPPTPVATFGEQKAGTDNRQITINNTFNEKIDPSQVARQMIWSLE